VYPVNFAFLDGRVSEELYEEEHELDYEQLKAAESAQDSPPDDVAATGLSNEKDA